ncbi:MAG TPA: thioredoxin domain-containing protein [Kofleriaceae bacterium]|nr:thioredoxin domain-containing protein [Kofleriaceae bacterium]
MRILLALVLAASWSATAHAQADRPDPALVYAVPVEGHPAEGPADALITIVEASDYACPYCERVRATLAQLVADYPGKLRIVHRNMVVHKNVAELPAQAACAAHLQGQFVAMHNLIYDKGFLDNRTLTRDRMEQLATELGLDLARFGADIDGVCTKKIADDQAQLARFGVAATPSFFINGRYLAGAMPIDQFKTLIDEELAKAQGRLKKGTKARSYYTTWVLKKGKRPTPAP